MNTPPTVLDADALHGILDAGALALERNVEAVNALNVFPVPDGDTGTNMLLTIRAVQQELAKDTRESLGGAVRLMARGALMGARGNSGVILSQFLRGLSRPLEDHGEAGPELTSVAFQEGAAAAYKAVSEPVEGTLLTVVRRTAEAMRDSIQGGEPDLVELFETALASCRKAVLQTPDQLPVLKEAGVVDAGGQGFAIMLEAALRYLQGEDAGAVHIETVQPLSQVTESFLEAAESELYGYCTQLLVSGTALDPDALRAQLSVLASSTVVIGDDTMVKIHVHTFDPGAILSLGTAVGTLGSVTIENIDEQHQEFQKARRQETPMAPLGVVAVAWGQGIEELFRSLGAGHVVVGGQTMNPSCQELLDAVESLRAETALVLPNNPNIIPTAHQAAGLSSTPLRVVETRNIPQGVAAMLAYNPEMDDAANAAAMQGAAASVRAGEVVTAVRDATVDGRAVRAGEVMGTLEGDLVVSGPQRQEVLGALVQHAGAVEGSLITLYWGGDTTEAEADEAALHLQDRCPGVDVELVHGGQPYYHYLVSIE